MSETRKQLFGLRHERYVIGATLLQGDSAVTVEEGEGVASCTGSGGEYTVVLTDRWTRAVGLSVTPELDHDDIATDEIITLANEIKADFNAHCADDTAHVAADATNPTTEADATTLATAYVLLNALKTDYEAHRVLTAGSVHGAADATNTIAAADATTLATAIALANELKTDYNAHRILTAASVHANADTTHVVASSSVTLATTPYCSIVSQLVDSSSKTITIATKDPTTGANAAMKAGGKIHLLGLLGRR